jgi:lysozyme family protein
MSDFNSAIPVILQHEGGWVSHPADPGGETNWGISSLIIQREGITNTDLGLSAGADPVIDGRAPGWLRTMPMSAAVTIYKRLFWDKYGYGRIAGQVAATKVFDCAVNCGPARAHAMAQRAANTLQAEQIPADGILGPKSVAAINNCTESAFVKAMAAQMTEYYTKIAQARPSLQVFLRNWLHRASWGT